LEQPYIVIKLIDRYSLAFLGLMMCYCVGVYTVGEQYVTTAVMYRDMSDILPSNQNEGNDSRYVTMALKQCEQIQLLSTISLVFQR